MTVALRRFSKIFPLLVSSTVSRRRIVARCACSSRSAFSRSASSGDRRLDSDCVCPSFKRADPASKSSTGKPHSLARVLIQSEFYCRRYLEPLGTFYLTPERAKFLDLQTDEPLDAFSRRMQITSAACAPRFEIHFDPSVHDRDSHHRRLRVALHASDAGPLGRGYDFSPASSAAAAGADSSAIVSLAASAPSASVAANAAASAAAVAADAAASPAAVA